MNAEPFANWIAPVPPIAVPPEERQVPPTAKHPPLVRLIPFAKVEVPEPVTARREVEAFVVDALVANKFVAVALVIVALVPKRLVKVPVVAFKIEAKKLVLVACVEVLRRIFAKMFAPEKVFASARRVDDAPLVLRQTPAIA